MTFAEKLITRLDGVAIAPSRVGLADLEPDLLQMAIDARRFRVRPLGQGECPVIEDVSGPGVRLLAIFRSAHHEHATWAVYCPRPPADRHAEDMLVTALAVRSGMLELQAVDREWDLDLDS